MHDSNLNLSLIQVNLFTEEIQRLGPGSQVPIHGGLIYVVGVYQGHSIGLPLSNTQVNFR